MTFLSYFLNSVYPHLPQDTRSLWVAMNTPGPHLGQTGFSLVTLSPLAADLVGGGLGGGLLGLGACLLSHAHSSLVSSAGTYWGFSMPFLLRMWSRSISSAASLDS